MCLYKEEGNKQQIIVKFNFIGICFVYNLALIISRHGSFYNVPFIRYVICKFIHLFHLSEINFNEAAKGIKISSIRSFHETSIIQQVPET